MWKNIITEFFGSIGRRGIETDEKRVREIPEVAWTWNKGDSKTGRKRNRFTETKCKI